MVITFLEDDLRGREINQLLQSHLPDRHKTSPAESVPALDLAPLQAPGITFWSRMATMSSDGMSYATGDQRGRRRG